MLVSLLPMFTVLFMLYSGYILHRILRFHLDKRKIIGKKEIVEVDAGHFLSYKLSDKVFNFAEGTAMRYSYACSQVERHYAREEYVGAVKHCVEYLYYSGARTDDMLGLYTFLQENIVVCELMSVQKSEELIN